MNCHVKDDDSSFFVYNISAALAQEVEHRRGKEEAPSSNLGSSLNQAEARFLTKGE